MPSTRRRALAATVTVATAALAGCLDRMPHDGEIATEPASETDATAADASLVHYADLSAEERDVVATAISDGVYHACSDLDTLSSLAGRLTPRTYLERDGDYYGLWVRVTDTVAADTADPPDEEFDCGWP
ncbi:MAG: hypothetical protein ABEJ80_08650 [Halarchaeum sp.]